MVGQIRDMAWLVIADAIQTSGNVAAEETFHDANRSV
jgi:hypothetical protein